MMSCHNIMRADSAAGEFFRAVSLRRCAFVAAALVATIASTLKVYPDQLAYFNEASGGPQNGHRHLLNSNLDWGQNLLDARAWIAADESRRPVYLAYHGDVQPAHIGIRDVLPVSPVAADGSLRPGWYLISQNYLSGSAPDARDGAEDTYRIDVDTMAAIRRARRIGSLGYSIAILHVPPARP